MQPIRGAELSSAKIFVENYEGVRVNIVPSDFDYTQRFVGSYLWDLPNPEVAARLQVALQLAPRARSMDS